MCFTFLAAQGHPIGDSLFEPDQVDTCRRLLAEAGKPIHLPERHRRRSTPAATCATFGTRLPDGGKGLDIGPGTAAAFADVIIDARTVFWNGPMGVFEDPRFAAGTRTVAEAVADTKAFTVVGGGDSAGGARRSSASPTRSTTSRPAAARRSSCSSSATCPASTRCARRRMPMADATASR